LEAVLVSSVGQLSVSPYTSLVSLLISLVIGGLSSKGGGVMVVPMWSRSAWLGA